MTLKKQQLIVTEDLRSDSLSTWDSLVPYSVGNVVKDASGGLYKCIAAAPAGTSLTNSLYFAVASGDGKGILASTVTVSASGTIPIGQKSSDLSANNLSMLLPLLSSTSAGDLYYVKVGNYTGCSVGRTPPNTIDGNTTPISLNPYDAITFRNNGSEWEISNDFRQNSGLTPSLLGAGASVNITPTNFFSVTGANNQAITLFSPAANLGTKFTRYSVQVLHNNVTITPASGLFSGVASRTFNQYDWVVMSNNGTDWFIIS